MDAIQKCNKVCLTTWNQGISKKNGTGSGMPQVLLSLEKQNLHRYQDYRRPSFRKLAEKYYPTVEEVEKEMNGSARSRVQLFAIRIEHMTGKLVNEK